MSCCDLSLPSFSKFAHCTSCCRTFFSPSSFDHHRVGGECQDPAGRGMRAVERKNLGPVWQRYVEPKNTEPPAAMGRVQKAYAEMTQQEMDDDAAAALLAVVPSLEKWTVLDLATALTGSTMEELADPTWWRRVMDGAPRVQAIAARLVGGRGVLPSLVVKRINASHLRRLRCASMSDEELEQSLRYERHDLRRLAEDKHAAQMVPRQRGGTSAGEHAEGSRA